ncbi:MAG: SUMF1/EgtB/PvdO family nonheme iron enzyme [Deltaproteobacteria bacterium]|nr:SUMF1/EgtB/PvdO family nonheme iron enzyme [Deltaproteobacteria bacterium]
MKSVVFKLGVACGFPFLLLAIYAYNDAIVSVQPPAVLPIKAGWFTMGSDASDRVAAVKICARETRGQAERDRATFQNEGPAHKVYLTAYRIDRFEVSNQAYRRCVLANACAPSRLSDRDQRLAAPQLPVAHVTWSEAQRYCKWIGGALPTEAQWERAARGVSGRRFPWGQFYNSRLANHGSDDFGSDSNDGYEFAAPVDSFFEARSQFGLLNMAGNVWELTADYYASRYEKNAIRVDPTGPEKGEARVIRGGSWLSPACTLRTTHRAQIGRTESRRDVGFRCAYSR